MKTLNANPQYVEPIKDKAVLRRVKETLVKHTSQLHADIWTVSLHSGWRISDVLQLSFEDAYSYSDTHIRIQQQKTKKYLTTLATPAIKQAITNRLRAAKRYHQDNFRMSLPVFISYDSNRSCKTKAVTYSAVYKQLQVAAEILGTRITCHTPRKSAAYQVYEQTPGDDITPASEFLGHSAQSFSATRRYIGITRDKTDQIVAGFDF